MKKTKTKNPQDATNRNVRASNKRHESLLKRIEKLEGTVAGLMTVTSVLWAFEQKRHSKLDLESALVPKIMEAIGKHRSR